MEDKDIIYKLWLASINIPNNIKVFLKNKFKNEKLLYEFYREYTSNNEMKLEYTNRIRNTLLEEGEKLLEELQKNNIKVMFYGEENYLNEFKELTHPPYVIFYKGDISKLKENRKISIVGSRNATFTGIQITEAIAKQLALNNVLVVSGGAYGVDTAAHKGAINSRGLTCAVLGCGLNVTYPKANYNLFKRICENGVIISEFLPNEKPLAYNFPRRNRIIGALGEALIITEAEEKSGSLITAGYALELGKNIFAVPGNPLNPTSKGCNELIRDGANIVTDIQDLLRELKIGEGQNITKNFSGQKGVVLREIGVDPIHIDDLIRICNIDINCIYGLLFELQVENEIISLAGNYYARIS